MGGRRARRWWPGGALRQFDNLIEVVVDGHPLGRRQSHLDADQVKVDALGPGGARQLHGHACREGGHPVGRALR